MTKSKYLSSIPGRIICGIAALALVGAGAIALSGTTSVFAITLLVLVLVAASIVTVGATIAEFPGKAAILVLSLPVIGGFYFAALYAFMPTAGIAVGGIAVAAGLLPAFVALRPVSTDDRSHESVPLRSAA